MNSVLAYVPKYEAYKNSGVDWLGRIPRSWGIRPLKYVLSGVSEKVSSAQSHYKFIGMGNVESWSGRIVESETEVEGLASKFRANDILFGKLRPYLAKVTLASEPGICSTEFLVYRTQVSSPGYFRYLLGSHSFIDLIDASTYGSKMPRANSDYIGEQRLPVPSYYEQTAIATFLDRKTTQIDQATAIKEQQITLLKERKQILIQNAVTRGLNPDAPMRDSGVEWIGEIPAHWDIYRSKFVFWQRKELAWKDDVQLSATQAYGVIPQEHYEEKTGYRVVKIQFHLEKRKHVEVDDFVISMRSFQGGLERAWSHGCIRSSYVVLRPMLEVDAGYFSRLFKSPRYIAALQATANFIRDGQDLNFNNYSMVDLVVPTLSEQREIAAKIDSESARIDQAINLEQQQIDHLEEYKATLINSAVTGKIKVPGVRRPESREEVIA